MFSFYFQDDMVERPKMATAINSLANYSAAIPSGPSDPDSKAPEKANLGTLMGVYLPCIQNIFGVILFIRMTWIVGTAGAIQGFFVVFLACCVVSYLFLTRVLEPGGQGEAAAPTLTFDETPKSSENFL